MNSWIYMDPNNRASVVVRRVTALGRTGCPTTIRPPPMSSIGINLAHPDEETTAVLEGHIMVATFHTHPSANPERYNPGLPSAQDNRLEWERGLPGIIIHDRGLTADPELAHKWMEQVLKIFR
ncbi:hypothetical protein H0H93_010775 [Arthromyces matolae]|nr:hypothetical protein H0H93_010775 [Arthromyces matolae]